MDEKKAPSSHGLASPITPSFTSNTSPLLGKTTGDVKAAQTFVTEVNSAPTRKELRLERAIRILRAVQSILSAALSVFIAGFQLKAYLTYRATQSVPGAWPPAPFIAPTLILFAVAVAAFVFDLCVLVAYGLPKRRVGKWAVTLALSMYWAVSMGKTAAYSVAAVVCRSGYNYGNSSGTNTDLWSWTCSNQAQEMGSVNQADPNCQMQSLAWYFSLANIGIEAVGFLIDRLVTWQKDLAQGRESQYAYGQIGDDGVTKLEEMRLSVNANMGQSASDMQA